MKIKALLFTILLALLLCSCGETQTEETTTAPIVTEQTEQTEQTTLVSEQTTKEEPLEIAKVIFKDKDDNVCEDVFATVSEGEITVHVPLILDRSALKSVHLSFLDESEATLLEGSFDLTVENEIEIFDGKYTLKAKRLSYGLPLIEIDTDGAKPIVEKNTYLKGTVTIDGEPYAMKVKGRGNASWTQFPKKAYRIKLDEGAPLLSLPKNRDFVFASNYGDKTLIRNCVAHTMALSLSGLEYTPTHIPVNLYLNGKYLGVYTFADRIEDGKGRLDLGETKLENGVSDIGFLLEIGWDYDSENIYNKDYFDTDWLYRIYIKEPEIEKANSPEQRYVKKYILATEKAIVNNDGWQDYIDIDSFIDWFIINEMTFNTESSFYRSCYLWRPAGGKLRMGPVWDFDMAFGNHDGDIKGYDGWCTTEATYSYVSENWMNHLLKYPEFYEPLTKRWNEVKDSLLEVALSSVDSYSKMLDGSQQQNFLVWDIMDKKIGVGSVSPKEYNTYDKQVGYLRDFIIARWSYIDNRLNK